MDFTNLKNFMDYMAQHRSPGNVCEVYLDGKSVFKYASGYSSLEKKTPLTGDEYFNMYSCSKLTTVTAGMQLLERGYFRMTDPLYEYIPEYRHMSVEKDGQIVEAKKPITIKNLFTMTAGFNYNYNADGFKKAYELTNGKMDTDVVIRCIASDPLHFEPGEHYKYSLCHDVLAGLISIITGMKFRDYVQKNIFDPLGMDKAVYHVTDEILEKTSEQYTFVPEGSPRYTDIVDAQFHGTGNKGVFENVGKRNTRILGDEYDNGGSGVTTTVSDYAKLMAALANGGTGVNGEKILSRYAVDLMRTPALDENPMKEYATTDALRGCGYGFGVRTHIDKTAGGIGNLGEFGWGGAAGSTAIIDPKINLALYYSQHCLNPRENWYQPRLRNVIYSCL